MMNCFPCFRQSQKDDEHIHYAHVVEQPKVRRTLSPQNTGHPPWAASPETKVNHYRKGSNTDAKGVDSSDIEANQFSFRELATAARNFRQECLIGESGFGKVYKGTLQPSGQVVTVKRLDKNSTQGMKEFLVEVHMLSLLRHSNLLNLVGYCAEGDQRLLVYDYMSMGSLKAHLLDMEKKSLDWETRMKIACGIAQGIEYLHNKANPAVIYRDLMCSNVMLDDDFNPKLSDHGLAKLGGNNKSQVTVMGSYGYCAPEYEKHGQLTVKSDVYNFGVVLLELITGRGAVDTTKEADEQNLVKWAQPIFKDPRRYPEMADPRLSNSFPAKGLNQAVGIAAMCLQAEPDVRPLISDVVAALTTLSLIPPDVHVPETKSQKKAPSRRTTRKASCRDPSEYSGDSSDCSWSYFSDDESDSESPCEEHNFACMEGVIGCPKNQYDRKDTHMDEKIGHHDNQNDRKDTHLDDKYDHKDLSTDEESNRDENRDEHKYSCMDEEIGHRESQHGQKDVSTNEESDYDVNRDAHKYTSMEEGISSRVNQYDQKDTHMDEETGHRENQFDKKDTHMDKETGDRENQHDQKDGRMDQQTSNRENHYGHKFACMDVKHGRDENHHDQKDCMHEESDSDFDLELSDSSDSSDDDTSETSRKSSRNRRARLDSKSKNGKGKNNEGLENGSVVCEKNNQSIGSYSWQSSIGRSTIGSVRSNHHSP